MISGYQIVVFFVVFGGIFAESRTVVRTVCGQFCGRSFALGVSFVSVCSNSPSPSRCQCGWKALSLSPFCVFLFSGATVALVLPSRSSFHKHVRRSDIFS